MSTEQNPPGYQVEVQEPFNIHELHAPIMREQAEPRDGFEPIPPYFAPIFGLVIFVAGFIFANKFGEFRADNLSEEPPPDPNAVGKVPTPAERGQRLFSTCAGCHGADGNGGDKIPPLAKSEWVQDRPPGVIIRVISHGVTGPITVKGQAYNNSMKLPDVPPEKNIADIVTYVRQAWGNTPKFPGEVTEDYVKAVRKKIAGRSTQWTASELEAVDDSDIPFGGGANVPEKDKSPEKDKPADKK